MALVMHGALGIIRVRGTAVGFMKSLRFSENYNRQEVRGISHLWAVEAPNVSAGGTLSCSFYSINFQTDGIPGFTRRDVQTKEQWEDQINLAEEGVQIDVFKKEADIIDPNTNLIIPKVVPWAVIRRCLIESDSADITEGALSNRDQSFRFLEPVLYPQ